MEDAFAKICSPKYLASMLAVACVGVAVFFGTLCYVASLPPAPLTEWDITINIKHRRTPGLQYAKLSDNKYLTWYEFGDPNGTPLVAFHDVGLSGYYFRETDEFFKSRNIRCIAPNILGGLFDFRENLDEEKMTEMTMELLDDHLKIDGKFYVVGHGWGALASLDMAAQPRLNDRIIRTGLISPIIRTSHMDRFMLSQLRNDFQWQAWFAQHYPGFVYLLHTIITEFVGSNFVLDSIGDVGITYEEFEMLKPSHPFREYYRQSLIEAKSTAGGFPIGYAWQLLASRKGPAHDYSSASGDIYLYFGLKDNSRPPLVAEYLHDILDEHKANITLDLMPKKGKLVNLPEVLERMLAY